MGDEFGTVNVKRGERSREIEALRQQYGHHRDALTRMVADAPTELLAKEYQRLIRELDNSLRKLDELEGRAPGGLDEETLPGTVPGVHPVPPGAGAGAGAAGAGAFAGAASASGGAAASAPRTAAGDRPLAPPPNTGAYAPPSATPANPQSRVAMIVVAAIVVLALIGWLIYRASSDRRHPAPIAGTAPTAIETVGTNPNPPAEPIAPPAGTAPAATADAGSGGGSIQITPTSADYGTIRKGTRAVRPFEVVNRGTEPIEIAVSRSTCRCLFYEYRGKILPKKKETITVAIDGARATAGPLNETVKVTLKNDPSVAASFNITAKIR